MTPFPTIGYVGNTAMFKVGQHWVCVPLKFGSSDRALHFVPLLYRLWQEHPFSVRKGVLVQRYTKQIDGVRKEVEENVAHRLFAAYAHQDIGFEWTEVTAKDGNFLCLTRENIVPVRNPVAPATDNEKEHAAQRQMTEHQFTGSFPFMMRFFAKFLRAQEQSDVITTEQLTDLQTASVKTLLEAERVLAAGMTRDDVEKQNFFERKLFLMTRPDLATEHRPENHPDGVVYTKPESRVLTSSNVPGVGDNEDDEADTKPARVPRAKFDSDYHPADPDRDVPARGYVPWRKYDVSRETYRADLQGRWNDPSTERVLNRHGWFSPANGGKPRYEGKEFNGVGEQVSRREGQTKLRVGTGDRFTSPAA